MFQYQFMQYALMAGLLIALLCPAVGIFLVLKRYSMMGDTLSHSSFAGIALGLTLKQNPLLVAFIFTSIAGILIEFLRKYFARYAELIMSIILTFSLGLGIIILGFGGSTSSINSFLFGSILTVTKSELITIAILSIIAFLVLIFYFNTLIYSTFDETGAKVAGIKVKFINYIFILIVGATISVSIKIVGILVISSLITLPVATALQFKKGFKITFFLSILFGFLDVLIGLISSYYIDVASGGLIAITSVACLIVVILLNSLLNFQKTA